MARVSKVLGLVLAALLAGTPRTVLAQDESDRAEQAFKEGNRAFATGDYHAAFEAYRTAWSIKQTFDIACNLGRTEVELSLSRDAAEHLDFCLRTFSVSSRDEVRDANKRFRELFQRVRREVAGLSLEVRPAGAEVTVDGASFGLAPLGRDLFLSPGSHLVRVRMPGYVTEERAITAEAAGSLSVTITLANAEAAPAPAPPAGSRASNPEAERPAATPPAGSGTQPRTIVLLSGGGLSLVAIGMGAYFALAADAARSDASKLGASVHASAGSCGVTATEASCASLQKAVDREQDNRNRADIALTTGAILGAVTVAAWLLIPDIARSDRAELKAAPWVGSDASGVALLGRY
jgi:hypothetical protein